ncbi:MAG: hypothetical protein ACI9G1_005633 [Pirellulaceae bacterium]|jgi:hypothetical protein
MALKGPNPKTRASLTNATETQNLELFRSMQIRHTEC